MKPAGAGRPPRTARRPAGRGRVPGTAARLATFHALLLAVVLAAVTYETGRAFTSHALDTTDRGLAAQVGGFAAAAGARPTSQDLRTFTLGYLRAAVLPSGQVMAVVLQPGGVLGSAESEPLLSSPLLTGLTTPPPSHSTFRRVAVGGVPSEVLATPLVADGRRAGTLVVAARLDQLRADQRRVLALTAAEAAVALVVATAAAYLLLRRLLRTVGDITDTAAAIGRGDLDQRLGDPGTDDEVGRLSATLDWMLDRLSRALITQRRLLADVSHQLRTPLTVARGHLEVMARSGADDPREVRATVSTVVDELDHMRTLVERLLLLGRSLEPDFLEVTRIDLRALLADIVGAARVLAPRTGTGGPVPDLIVEVDEPKLRGVLLNLVDNAVKATEPNDRIEITATRREDGSLVLAVDDSGPGIPEEQVAQALARFGRPGTADSEGSGLGLAIAKAVAETHGGSFELGRSSLGGCRAAVVVPPERVLEPAGVVEVA